MKLFIVYESRIPVWLGAEAVFAPPMLLFRHRKGRVPKRVLRHELVHVEQLMRDGWGRFALKGAWDFFAVLVETRSWEAACTQTPYEIEAYRREREPLTGSELAMFK